MNTRDLALNWRSRLRRENRKHQENIPKDVSVSNLDEGSEP
jgi:hypothetical protein